MFKVSNTSRGDTVVRTTLDGLRINELPRPARSYGSLVVFLHLNDRDVAQRVVLPQRGVSRWVIVYEHSYYPKIHQAMDQGTHVVYPEYPMALFQISSGRDLFFYHVVPSPNSKFPDNVETIIAPDSSGDYEVSLEHDDQLRHFPVREAEFALWMADGGDEIIEGDFGIERWIDLDVEDQRLNRLMMDRDW
jgi:hypothetical protein